VSAVSLLATACITGNGGPSPTEGVSTVTMTSSPTTTLATNQAAEEFRQCLSDSGVDIGPIPIDATGRPRLDLALDGLDFEDPVVIGAMTDCAAILEGGALDLAGDEKLRQAILTGLTDFSDCMVRHGVEQFPNPLPGFLGVGSPFPVAEIPYADPQFDSAVAACRAPLVGDLDADGGTP
jgi:hypothetical protein